MRELCRRCGLSQLPMSGINLQPESRSVSLHGNSKPRRSIVGQAAKNTNLCLSQVPTAPTYRTLEISGSASRPLSLRDLLSLQCRTTTNGWRCPDLLARPEQQPSINVKRGSLQMPTPASRIKVLQAHRSFRAARWQHRVTKSSVTNKNKTGMVGNTTRQVTANAVDGR